MILGLGLLLPAPAQLMILLYNLAYYFLLGYVNKIPTVIGLSILVIILPIFIAVKRKLRFYTGLWIN